MSQLWHTTVTVGPSQIQRDAEKNGRSLTVTGQQSLETDRQIREDVFKRYVSGDPVA